MSGLSSMCAVIVANLDDAAVGRMLEQLEQTARNAPSIELAASFTCAALELRSQRAARARILPMLEQLEQLVGSRPALERLEERPARHLHLVRRPK